MTGFQNRAKRHDGIIDSATIDQKNNIDRITDEAAQTA
jgi:hypothetical protein